MKTLITAVMLTVMGTAGFAETPIETANKVIPKGSFISTTSLSGGHKGFVMTYKGKVYLCYAKNRDKVHCLENTED